MRELLNRGYKPMEVARALNTSKQLVYKWMKKDPLTQRKPRKSKIKKFHIQTMKKLGEDKFTGINHASSRKIAHKLERLFNKGSKTFKIFHTSVNKLLNESIKQELLNNRCRSWYY